MKNIFSVFILKHTKLNIIFSVFLNILAVNLHACVFNGFINLQFIILRYGQSVSVSLCSLFVYFLQGNSSITHYKLLNKLGAYF